MRYSIPRKSRRVPLSTLVNLKLERLSGAVTEITSDLSLGGMFVPSDTPAEIGSLVAFEFKVGEDLVEGTGEVVWQRMEGDGAEQPPGMGIRFRYLSPGSRERIFRLVQRYTQDGEEALSAPPAESSPKEAVPAGAERTPRVAVAGLQEESPGASPAASPAQAAEPAAGSLFPELSATSKVREPSPLPPAGFVLPEILQPPAEEEARVAIPEEAKIESAPPAKPAEERSTEAGNEVVDEIAVAFEVEAPGEVETPEESSEPVSMPTPRVATEDGPGVELSSQSARQSELPAAVTEPLVEEEVEIPDWLRPDPPDLPDLPVAPVSEPIMPGEMTPIYDGDDTADPGGSTGEWRLRGAGYAGGKESRGLRLDGRKIVFGILILLLAAAAIYRLAGPLLGRFTGGREARSNEISENASATERAEVAVQSRPVPVEPGDQAAAVVGQGTDEPAPLANQEPTAADTEAADTEAADTEAVSSPPATVAPAPGAPVTSSQKPSEGTRGAVAVAKPRPAPTEPAPVVVTKPMTRIRKIHWRAVAGGTLVTIEADGAIAADRFKRLRLEQAPPRELVRFLRVSRPFEPTHLAVGNSELVAIRTGFHPGRELHIVLDLADPLVKVISADTVGTELRILLRRP